MKRFLTIYLITNLVNKKIYIGKHCTDDLNDNYFGSGVIIKEAIKKYGIENFTKIFLHIGTDLTNNELNEFERYYINLYNANDPKIGYNLTEGGDGGKTSGSFQKGHKDSLETRKKKSESHKNKHHSEETKQKIRETNIRTKSLKNNNKN